MPSLDRICLDTREFATYTLYAHTTYSATFGAFNRSLHA